MRRVVITGLGLVTPLGADVETAWANILAARSGAGRIERFDATDYACRIACEVKPADHAYGFDPNKRVDHKVQRQVDPFIIYGIDAAGQAYEDSGLGELSEEQSYRAGVSIGSGIGGLPGIESESLVLAEKGPRRVSRTSSTAASSTSSPARSRSNMGCAGPTTPSSPPARPVRTRSAMRRG